MRDVSYGEDRNHARAVALALSSLRTVALNLIRHLGFRFIPDGWRVLAAQPDPGLSPLLHPVKAISENEKPRLMDQLTFLRGELGL